MSRKLSAAPFAEFAPAAKGHILAARLIHLNISQVYMPAPAACKLDCDATHTVL